MALNETPFHFTDGVIKGIDNTPTTPLEITFVNVVGDVSYSGTPHGGGNRSLSIYQTQGGSNAPNGKTRVRAGAHEPGTLTINVHAYDMTETSVGSIRDWWYRVAGTPFASAVGFEDNDLEVFSCKIELTLDLSSIVTGASDQVGTYTRCVLETLQWSMGEPNAFSMTLKVLGTETWA